jgi:HK97 family phage portal protein
MNVFTKIWSFPGRFLKALSTGFIHPQGSGLLGSVFPRSRFNFAGNVDSALSSPVMACINWVIRNFPEAPIQVRRRDNDGNWDTEFEHAFTQLLKRPNPFYSGPLLLMAVLADYMLGNAYIRKVRSGAGRVVQLWWLPSALVQPKWSLQDPTIYISHYEYNVGSGRPERIPVEDIVHLRWGLDPQNTRLGMSPIKSVLREIFTDDEAANFSAALLRNLGIPGVILSPKDGTVAVDRESAEGIKQSFRENFGGDNRGDVMVMLAPTDAHVMSFSPQQMNMRDLRKVPEERISAVLGIPAIVAGLGAGLDRSTFANMAEAREMGFENGIIPLQRIIAAELTEQLLIDFEDAVMQGMVEVFFDIREVRVLQEDQNQKATRIRDLVAGGILKRSEGRAEMGYAFEDSDEIYYIPISIDERRPGEELTPLEMLPVQTEGDPSREQKTQCLERPHWYQVDRSKWLLSLTDDEYQGAIKNRIKNPERLECRGDGMCEILGSAFAHLAQARNGAH